MGGRIIEFPRASARFAVVTACFRPARERLYRRLLIRADADLIELGCALTAAFGASPAHLFVFLAGGRVFAPRSLTGQGDALPMAEYTLKDLGGSFGFLYDVVGDGWMFDCTVAEELAERTERRRAVPLDGAGQGIWEDNLETLKRYLAGEVKADEPVREDPEHGIHPPWNFDVAVFGDFDAAPDVRALGDLMDARVPEETAMLRGAEESERVLTDEELREALAADEAELEAAEEARRETFEKALPEAADAYPAFARVLEAAVENAAEGFAVAAYKRLSRREGEAEALETLRGLYFEELMGLLTGETPFGTEHLREELDKLL